MRTLEDIRAAVADELEARGLANRDFLHGIRAGAHDEGPYMIGAVAVANRLRATSKS